MRLHSGRRHPRRGLFTDRAAAIRSAWRGMSSRVPRPFALFKKGRVSPIDDLLGSCTTPQAIPNWTHLVCRPSGAWVLLVVLPRACALGCALSPPGAPSFRAFCERVGFPTADLLGFRPKPPPISKSEASGLSPLRGLVFSPRLPTACAVGCILSPLRGWWADDVRRSALRGHRTCWFGGPSLRRNVAPLRMTPIRGESYFSARDRLPCRRGRVRSLVLT